MPNPKVLIVEDDPIARRFMSALMEKLGHEVELAENGMEAWKIFDRKPVSLIISDWAMPELDGLELCKKVRARRETAYTYFILLTSKSSKENYLQAMMAQVDDFLTKPLDQDELTIRLWVANRILGYTARIQQLEDILPVCSYCKKVRDEKNDWYDLARYLAREGKTAFSHGICPECYQKHARPAISKLKKSTRV
jgi:phosphoserine phosphatase RsbU/P